MAFFSGREKEIELSIERLLGNRFLVIVAASGAGKTSLIRAGIIPRIRAEHENIQPIVVCRFGADPMANLAAAVSQISAHEDDSTTPLLVIDQFEELYSISEEIDRRNVLREFAQLVNSDTVAVLISLRADFVGRLLETPILAERFNQSVVSLGAMSRASLQRTIVEPAQIAGIKFEASLVDRLIEDAGTGIDALPLLQMALSYLVVSDDDGVITLEDFEQLGTQHGPLGQIPERLWQSASEQGQRVIRRMMIRLVGISEDGTASTRVVPLDEFSIEERPLVERFVAEQVLTLHHDPQSDQTVVEVVHEATFRVWPRFGEWIEAEREFLSLRSLILDAAMRWEKSGRDSSYLISGRLLEQAKELLHKFQSALSIHQLAFIEQSINAEERFSALKLLMSGLGLSNLQKEVVERGERRAAIYERIHALDDQLRELETKKAELSKKLNNNKQDVEAMSPKVFISYASEDFQKVKPLYDQLKNQGIKPWLDRENLLPGVNWDREIVREIKQSHFVLFCLSSRSISKRGYVQKELKTALSAFEELPAGQTYLIPVRLEECDVPDELSKYQVADVFRDGEFNKLLRSIFRTWAESVEDNTD